jgi:secondary thiamine-phosphate synthase enzyme
MKQKIATITLRVGAEIQQHTQLYDFTEAAAKIVKNSGIRDGLCTCFIRHTSASLLIQENADPDVLRDLEDFFKRIVPRDAPYRHDTEGPDDMPSHIKSALTATSLSIPLQQGKLALGTWQALYLFEHRDAPHTREVMLHLIGE